MNPSAAAILADPQPCGHIVYPYTDEAHIAEAVSIFASAGFRKDEAVLLIMLKHHAGPIRTRLEAEGFNLVLREAAGQLICADAPTLLSTFFENGQLNEPVFKTQIGNMIQEAKGKSGGRPVRVFGEMVDLLWKDNLKTTQRLEELWNDVIQAHSVPLLCAYSLAGTMPSTLPACLHACHSHAIS